MPQGVEHLAMPAMALSMGGAEFSDAARR